MLIAVLFGSSSICCFGRFDILVVKRYILSPSRTFMLLNLIWSPIEFNFSCSFRLSLCNINVRRLSSSCFSLRIVMRALFDIVVSKSGSYSWRCFLLFLLSVMCWSNPRNKKRLRLMPFKYSYSLVYTNYLEIKNLQLFYKIQASIFQTQCWAHKTFCVDTNIRKVSLRPPRSSSTRQRSVKEETRFRRQGSKQEAGTGWTTMICSKSKCNALESGRHRQQFCSSRGHPRLRFC